MKVLIVFASQTGRTRRMAEAAANGARDAGAEVVLRSSDEVTDSEVIEADGILLGSGVHMGGIESSMCQFFERTAPLWLQGRLVGKFGGAFVSAGEGGRGGGELAILSLLANLAEHGMLLVPMHNRMEGFGEAGSHWGPMARTNPRAGTPGPTDAQLTAARSHGQHFAQCIARWLRGKL